MFVIYAVIFSIFSTFHKNQTLTCLNSFLKWPRGSQATHKSSRRIQNEFVFILLVNIMLWYFQLITFSWTWETYQFRFVFFITNRFPGNPEKLQNDLEKWSTCWFCIILFKIMLSYFLLFQRLTFIYTLNHFNSILKWLRSSQAIQKRSRMLRTKYSMLMFLYFQHFI